MVCGSGGSRPRSAYAAHQLSTAGALCLQCVLQPPRMGLRATQLTKHPTNLCACVAQLVLRQRAALGLCADGGAQLL
eukprot:SAG11_NODE_18094_length_500_cov_0.763092_1_plen_76_part_01